jgi:hypothetical protein
LPLAVADRRGPPPTSLPGDAVQTFIRREDAERFIDEVRGDDLELASHLRIEARSKHSFHERWASLCVVPNGNRIALRRHLKVNVTLSAVFVGRLFGGPDGLKRITRYQEMAWLVPIDCCPTARASFSRRRTSAEARRTCFRCGRTAAVSCSRHAAMGAPVDLRDERGRHGLTQVTHGPAAYFAAWGSHR